MPEGGYPENRKKWPKVLAFDTSGPFLSVGWATQGKSGGTVLDMPRGQAETLFPTIEQQLADCGWQWGDVHVIGVGIGPGNFTGIRISVSAARGLGLALGIPVFGLNQFELTFGHSPVPAGTLISVAAPGGRCYVQGYGTGGAQVFGEGRLIDPESPPKELQLSSGMEIYGHRATELAVHFEARGYDDSQARDPARMAEMTKFKYLDAHEFPARPAPQYVKPPDAAPARDTPPVILP